MGTGPFASDNASPPGQISLSAIGLEEQLATKNNFQSPKEMT